MPYLGSFVGLGFRGGHLRHRAGSSRLTKWGGETVRSSRGSRYRKLPRREGMELTQSGNKAELRGGAEHSQAKQKEDRAGRLWRIRDLRSESLFNAGGKLLMFHGWSDPNVALRNTVNYYNEVLKTMGGESRVSGSIRPSWLREWVTAPAAKGRILSIRLPSPMNGSRPAKLRTGSLPHTSPTERSIARGLSAGTSGLRSTKEGQHRRRG